MIQEQYKFLCKEQRKVMPKHLSVEILGGGTKKDLMPEEQVFVIKINSDDFGNCFVFQILEEFVQIFRITNLTLNRKLDIGLYDLIFLEISFSVIIFVFNVFHSDFQNCFLKLVVN